MYEELIGLSTGFQKMEYTWRDMALYALGVGAGPEDLVYTYEKEMKAIPTFGTLPCFNAIHAQPRRPTTYPGVFIVRDYLEKTLEKTVNCMHLSSEFLYYQPIDTIKGTLIYEEKVSDIYDWGDRGIVVKTVLPVYNEAGQLLCETANTNVCYGGGGYRGKPVPKSTVVIPGREPDVTVEGYMNPVQNVIYRLSGDTHPAHVDPETAKNYGQPGAFMHGLCSYGYACRMAVKGLMDGEPDRFVRMEAQMRSVVFPDTKIELQAWRVEEHKAVFRLVNTGTGKAVLDKGIVEWK